MRLGSLFTPSPSASSLNSRSRTVDLVCPYSEKQLVGVKKTILPLIEEGKLDLKVILRQVS